MIIQAFFSTSSLFIDNLTLLVKTLPTRIIGVNLISSVFGQFRLAFIFATMAIDVTFRQKKNFNEVWPHSHYWLGPVIGPGISESDKLHIFSLNHAVGMDCLRRQCCSSV